MEELENKENFAIADQLRLGVLKSECVFAFSNYHEALIIANSVIEQGKANPALLDIVVEACIQKAWVEYRLGQLKEAMESIEMGLLPPQQQAPIIEQTIIPSIEACAKLEAEKKILAGGIFAGQRAGVAIVEAASNEELS